MKAIARSSSPPLRVLYLHHVGPFGGASRSMMEMIEAFPSGSVEPRVLLPRGQVADIMRIKGIPVQEVSGGVAQFDNCAYSFYRGLRWIVLLRELLLLPSTILAMRRAFKQWPQIDLVHINEVTMIPSLLLVRRFWPDVPIVLHVRSVQRMADGWRSRWIERLLKTKVNAVVAIDDTVRGSLPSTIKVTVVHNGLTVTEKTVSPRTARRQFTVAMVGSISRVKGCVEFARAAAICKAQGLDVHFIYVGQAIRAAEGLRHWLLQNLGLSQEVDAELAQIVDENGLQEMVEFRPFTTDLVSVYSNIDVICFPSHFDAPGRPIFEAAFFGVPAIAAISNPKPDTIVDGVTGLTIQPKSAEQLAQAIEKLYRNPCLCKSLGQSAKKHAEENFDASRNALSILNLYRGLISPTCAGR